MIQIRSPNYCYHGSFTINIIMFIISKTLYILYTWYVYNIILHYYVYAFLWYILLCRNRISLTLFWYKPRVRRLSSKRMTREYNIIQLTGIILYTYYLYIILYSTVFRVLQRFSNFYNIRSCITVYCNKDNYNFAQIQIFGCIISSYKTNARLNE